MIRKTVLSVGYDSTLTSGRSLAFQRAGYRVFTVADINTALNSILTYELDILLLCHTIPQPQQERLIDAIRRYRPRARVCVLAKGNVLMAA